MYEDILLVFYFICDGRWSLRLLDATLLGIGIETYSNFTENDKQQMHFLSCSRIPMTVFIGFSCSVSGTNLVIFDR